LAICRKEGLKIQKPADGNISNQEGEKTMISRRDFLKYCGISAAALGLSSLDLLNLREALANPGAPSVIWLQGSSCSGCSVSFLNLISSAAPKTAAEVLTNSINLIYHPTLMPAAGQSAAAVAEEAAVRGGYVLAVEGGIPTAFNGGACIAWEHNGVEVTFADAVTKLSANAAAIISIGACSAFGGIPAVSKETGVQSVSAFTGRKAINIAGCPPHPDWIVWTVVQLLLNKPIDLDSYGRPSELFRTTIHDQCPRRDGGKAKKYAEQGKCLVNLGCKGPITQGNCPTLKWNNGVNWCVNANAPCIGCTNPDFPAHVLMPGLLTGSGPGREQED
jgi:hydrogenase small subunit